MQPRVRVVQHVADEGPGLIAVALAREGIGIDVTRVDRGEPVPADLGGALGLVVLGGSQAVYEADRHPHLRDELRLIESALRAGAPVLGVCLGSQLLAAALGARVSAAPAREVGWFAVTPTPAARDDRVFGALPASFVALPASFVALHWHGDVFELPRGATSLARSAQTEHQAFRYGEHAHGLLFHLEATLAQVEAMVAASTDELNDAGVSGDELLDATTVHVAASADVGVALFQRWASLLRA
jgi:GMP synthase (glutamine-hydrolysing)